ncbi:MAG: acyltransferase family protein [Alphaproteobacteria bacterium]
MQYRQDIQVLRGIAVLFVLLYHFQAPFFQNGYLGVDIFFVISGFLMAKLYDRGSIADFYKRRIDRLLPAYAVTIIVTLIIGICVLIPPDFNQLAEQALSSAFFASNVHFWYQNSYFSASEFNPLLNLWSLAVEAQFYLIVPFLYPLLRERKWLLVLTIILSFAACVLIQSISPKTSFFLMPFRIWEFLLGAIVAWYVSYTNQETKFLNGLRFILPVLLVVFLLVAILKPNDTDILTGHPSFSALFICTLTASIIALGFPKFFENGLISKGVVKSLEKIGDYSYSIYLVHFPVIVLMNYQIFGGTNLRFDNQWMALSAIVVTAVLSFLSYQYVEQRGRKIFNTNILRLSLIFMIVIIALGAGMFNQRSYTPLERNIFAGLEDRAPYRCGKIFRILNPLSDVCLIGREGFKENILFVGDSYADALKTTLVNVANSHDKGVFFYVDNDPLIKQALSPQKIIKDAVSLNVDTILLHYSNKYSKDKFTANILELANLAKQERIRISLIAPLPDYEFSVPKANVQ